MLVEVPFNKDLKQVKSLAESYSITYFRKAQPWAGGLGSELNLRLLYIHQVAPYFEGKTLTEATSSFLETLLQDYKNPERNKGTPSKDHFNYGGAYSCI